MKTKADLKKIARQIWRKHQGKTLRSPSIMHPEREWLIGLSLAFTVVVMVAVWSGFTYIDNKRTIESGLTVEVPNTIIYTEGSVADALVIIEERRRVVDSFTKNAPTTPPEESEEEISDEETILEQSAEEGELEEDQTPPKTEGNEEPTLDN